MGTVRILVDDLCVWGSAIGLACAALELAYFEEESQDGTLHSELVQIRVQKRRDALGQRLSDGIHHSHGYTVRDGTCQRESN